MTLTPRWVRRAVTTTVVLATAALGTALTAPAASAATPVQQHARSCAAGLTAGEQTWDLTVDGVARTAIVYVPASAKRAAAHGGVPILVALHGSNNTPRLLIDVVDLEPSADRQGDVLIVPQGSVPGSTAGTYAWNVPGVTAAPAGTPDDVRFLSVLVDRAVGAYCGEGDEVFATGYSGGGRMISAVACAEPGVFDAIAPVVGLRAGVPEQTSSGTWVPDTSTCSPRRGTPVIAFTGTADPVNPAGGGGAAYWQYSAQQAVDGWLAIDGCRGGRAHTVTTSEGTYTRTVGTWCRPGLAVTSYVVDGMGHTWPGGDKALFTAYASVLGAYSGAVNANDVMWRFFRSVA